MARIAVLALQGAFERHATALRAVRHSPVLARREEDFAGVEGLVLPGGESSVQLTLLQRLDLSEVVARLVRSGCPTLTTCAGTILAARRVTSPEQESFGFVDIAVTRNGWGRQVESFEAVSESGRSLVMIRAPRIVAVGDQVEVLDRLAGEPVLVRQRNVTCATFHPELTDDFRLHEEVFGLPAASRDFNVGRPTALSDR